MNEITKRELNGFQRGIRERTVPENMRWPMFEDGKAVALGDATEDCRCVTRICFTKKGFYFNSSHRKGLRRYRYGEAVRRPWTPDADGVRTKVGDTVWNLGDGGKGVVTEVKGDSMIDANIYPGDYVFFSKGLIKGEGIYVIAFAGDIMVKRLSFDAPRNKLSIISENKNYPVRIIDAESDGVRILGKVIGWIHNEMV